MTRRRKEGQVRDNYKETFEKERKKFVNGGTERGEEDLNVI